MGYRSVVAYVAKKLGVSGSVRNADDGSVQIVACADKDSISRFIRERYENVIALSAPMPDLPAGEL